MATAADDAASRPQRTFLGHPVGLYVLFFTEMWERFSYYGMRALLILYMVNYFKWTQKDASTIYKVYTSFVYVTPILGGYLADRYLGNRRAVIIGAVLMAIGHFLMAFEEYPIFMAALIFLIFGNGFFKPNMSTQVGRLYPANDGRRDGAYTIFYMGINLGAFLSPLICGWLAENTVGGFHSGFTMAGIGMVLGLLIYVLGQPFIKELPPDAPPMVVKTIDASAKVEAHPPTEAEAARMPSVLGNFANLVPGLLGILGGLLIAAAPVLWQFGKLDFWDMIMLAIGGFCLALIGYVTGKVQGGVRDRVLAILVLGLFVIFFWGAFEQAGNVLNIWADQVTDRHLTRAAPTPEVIPQVIEDQPKAGEEIAPAATGFVDRFVSLFPNMVRLKPGRQGEKEVGLGEGITNWFSNSFNPMPTAWFQSINALAIFVLAPLFAWLWISLDRRGMQPSIPMKMALGLFFMSASMVVMIAAANQEHQRTTVTWAAGQLPEGIGLTKSNQLIKKDGHEPFHAGRLTYDSTTSKFVLDGVLDENERDRLIDQTAPKDFRTKLQELREASQKIDGDKVTSAEVRLEREPPGFDLKYSGLRKSVVHYRKSDRTLLAYQPLADKEIKGLLIAGGDPTFRDTIHEMFVQSTRFRVSAWWLFWSYILATLGELCLSPVGLSMVSKLAPAKFATMLMGVWLLTSAIGNFAAGALGEVWGTITPVEFFVFAAAVVGGSALVLLILSRWVTATMHGVK